jgi:hypothetical protein
MKNRRRVLWPAGIITAVLILVTMTTTMQAQVVVTGEQRQSYSLMTQSDTLMGAADTTALGYSKKWSCANWPTHGWVITWRVDSIPPQDAAQLTVLQWGYLTEPGGAWSVRDIDSVAQPIDLVANGHLPYQIRNVALTMPTIKPCSLRVRAFATDANTCSTIVRAKTIWVW